MCFSDLPDDLQDIVVGFCFEIRTKELKRDLETIFEIKSWKLPPRLLPNLVFCTETCGYVPHPLTMYRPMSHFRNKRVMDVLHRLDFRKRSVRVMGVGFGLFSVFFKEVEKNPRNLKPNWIGMSMML